jgi:hypothetical protein
MFVFNSLLLLLLLLLVLLLLSGLSGVRAPGIRNETHDFVREGRLLSK